MEKANNKDLNIISCFPTIGRGNVLRNDLKNSKQINDEIDKILKVK